MALLIAFYHIFLGLYFFYLKSEIYLRAVLFFAFICVYADITYKSNTTFLDGMYTQLNAKYNNSVPHDLFMNFIIAETSSSLFYIL